MKEQFKQCDIDQYNVFEKNISDAAYNLNDFIIIKYEIDNIKLPIKSFAEIFSTKLTHHSKYLPLKIIVRQLETPEKSYWTFETNYVGITDNSNNYVLYLRKGTIHSNISLLWIMLHEFRHIIQYNNANIETNIRNSNVELWLENYNKPTETLTHVLHEIMPAEIDANIFACEILGIDYPGSKFMITPDTLQLLNI